MRSHSPHTRGDLAKQPGKFVVANKLKSLQKNKGTYVRHEAEKSDDTLISSFLIHICDQCPGEDEHAQNEVHALLFCQDYWVCEPRKHLSFLFTTFFCGLFSSPTVFAATGQQPTCL